MLARYLFQRPSVSPVGKDAVAVVRLPYAQAVRGTSGTGRLFVEFTARSACPDTARLSVAVSGMVLVRDAPVHETINPSGEHAINVPLAVLCGRSLRWILLSVPMPIRPPVVLSWVGILVFHIIMPSRSRARLCSETNGPCRGSGRRIFIYCYTLAAELMVAISSCGVLHGVRILRP